MARPGSPGCPGRREPRSARTQGDLRFTQIAGGDGSQPPSHQPRRTDHSHAARCAVIRDAPSSLRVWPGTPYPLGATWDGEGTNFAIFSENADGVELCLFDAAAAGEEAHRIGLVERTDLIWHAYLPDVRPGQLYGYRVHGPYDPSRGH